MEAKTIDFFESLSQRVYSENNLSDITWSLTEASFEFKKFFFDFFFREKDSSDDFIRGIEIIREYTKDKSRPDFFIKTREGNFLIEVKKYDKDYHFKDYKETFIDDKKAFISIYTLSEEDKELGKSNDFIIKTWAEFYSDLEKLEFTENKYLIEGYLNYIKNVCNIIKFTEMEIQLKNKITIPDFIGKIFEIIDSVEKNLKEKGYKSRVVKNSTEYGIYIKNKTTEEECLFFGVWYPVWKEKKEPFCIGVYNDWDSFEKISKLNDFNETTSDKDYSCKSFELNDPDHDYVGLILNYLLKLIKLIEE